MRGTVGSPHGLPDHTWLPLAAPAAELGCPSAPSSCPTPQTHSPIQGGVLSREGRFEGARSPPSPSTLWVGERSRGAGFPSLL